MDREGPPLELLMHRLAETPQDFLAEPFADGKGAVHVPAVVHDLLRILGGTCRAETFAPWLHSDRASGGVTLVLCWLLADEWFRQHRPDAERVLALLSAEAAQLAKHATAAKFVADSERREELARLTLGRLGWRPAGETLAQAQDRLTSLSGVERARVMQAARVAEERARAIREALARKAAEESADKWTRE